MMHAPEAKDHPPVTVVLTKAREAYDLAYYAQRIADPELLENGLAVCMMRMPLLAVPVGGSRRGGYYPVPCLCFGLAVRDALRGNPGFPFLRVRWSVCPDDSYVVEWGAKPPSLWPGHNDAILGRFYGYSEAAIEQYTAAQLAEAPTAPPNSCPVFSPERPLV
ncbi:DUF6302 family protein [Streptomyces spectabilis]|uniref:DUF6302 family protein n=1 Tax=Streptomyces spectabilis TaxID=68270 RepID=UPI0033D4AD09